MGILNPMHSTIPYILISEYLSHEERDDYMTLMFVTESFSGIFCTIFFFIYQHWKFYLYINLVYGLIFIFFSFLLYESPRFLYSQKRYDEAKEVFNKIAKFNGIQKQNIIFEKEEKEKQLLQENENILDKQNPFEMIDRLERLERIETKPSKEVKMDYSYKVLFDNIYLRKFIIILPFIWFLDAFAFFTINFMIKYLKGEVYLNNTIIFISEVISYTISSKLMELFGKRNTMIYSFIISGIAFFVFSLVDSNIYIIYVLVFFSKFGASVILNVSSLYTNESFPTEVRGRATAICSFVGKLGGVFAPMLVELPYPSLMAIVSGLLCFSASLMLIPLENKPKKSVLVDNTDEITGIY